MGDGKTSVGHFMFMRSYLNAVEDLDEKDQLETLLAIVRYGLNGEEPTEKGTARAILRGFKPVLNKSREKVIAGNTPKRNRSETEAEQKRNRSGAKAEAKQKRSGGEASRYGEGEGEGEGEGVVSEEEEKKEIKKNQEEESPQPSTPSTSTNEYSIKEDTEALELLRNLTESERNPGAPPLILPTDVRERYARILKNAKDGSTSYYTDIPCAGGFCRSHVQVSIEDLQKALKTKKLPNDAFFCSHCKEHGGTGRLFENWRKACPKRFQEGIDTARFPQDAWERIKEWGRAVPVNEQSLYIYGRVGTGKSRMAYFTLFNYVARRRMSLKTFTWVALQDALRKNSAENLYRELIGIDVVLLDDFGADKLTSKATTKLQSVIETKLLGGKRIIFVSSVPPEDLELCNEKTPAVERLITRIKTDCALVEATG